MWYYTCTKPSRRPGRNNIGFTTTPFSCPPPPSLANKTLEVELRKEKTSILIVHGPKIIMSLWLISRENLRRHNPHLYWSERGYLLPGPMIWGTRPQPTLGHWEGLDRTMCDVLLFLRPLDRGRCSSKGSHGLICFDLTLTVTTV